MNKTLIGLIFLLIGLVYGSLALDHIYQNTLGWLEKNGWIKPPENAKEDDLKKALGRKPVILLYASLLIIIGLFILWNS